MRLKQLCSWLSWPNIVENSADIDALFIGLCSNTLAEHPTNLAVIHPGLETNAALLIDTNHRLDPLSLNIKAAAAIEEQNDRQFIACIHNGLDDLELKAF